ncbi:MAG: RagB/SusD family nutrient uptake outer membrane protein [Bacteroidales bacterium]|nr:RagB/SusD family nutrient uptake outer membrane protein [Bacteroidales bacterium]MCD8394381.1 RagB/SusD family nutrient uptake outer membrane protein [Bacteroidales bacterium]
MKTVYTIIIGLLVAMSFSSCTDDLNQKPIVETDSSKVYSTPEGYKMVLAKIYASYCIIGQEKASNADLSSFNGQDFLRCLFNLQEAATDEVAMRWLSGDELTNLSFMTWDASDSWVSDTYYRLYYTIALCNEFLRYTDDGSISGFDSSDQNDIRTYAYEARFMRALSYYFVLDLFGQGPFVDQDTPTSAYNPPCYTAQQLFDYVAAELEEITPQLPSNNEYGRAGKGAAYALQSRLYLNAEVYTGTAHYTECITACKNAISLGYSLHSDYSKLFNADNNLRTDEIIFAFVCDATTTVSWGSGTYLVCGSCGSDSDQDPAKYGLDYGWGSWRVRGELPALFGTDFDNNPDSRCMFFTSGQSQDIVTALDEKSEGFYSEKWTNLTDAGAAACSSNDYGCSTDFPMFRLAEIYLNAAEATLRGGSGMTTDEAMDLVNKLRDRAYGDTSGRITATQFNKQWVLDERARELYHECVRRTDLIRYGQFTTDAYLWQFKGGVADGRAVNSRYNIYPIPDSDISANPNLSNPLY